MTIQARMTAEDKRLYNPSRDVAHNFQQVMHMVAARLEDNKWPELDQLLKRENVSIDDLGEACCAYCTYIASAATDPKMSMFESLNKAGFFKCKPAAQVAVLAMIGSCYAGIQYAGVREATISGEGPLQTVADLMKYAEEFRKYAGMSSLRRWYERLKLKLKTMLAILIKS
jgi:hypothetical protein